MSQVTPTAEAVAFMKTRPRLVVMGVAGCGKSTLGMALAASLGVPYVEGDDHHGPANKAKMQSGQALNDDDRAGWLQALGESLASHEASGVVLTCSALKLAYRERLRRAAPGLRIVYLQIDAAEARERVASRQGHFFSTRLVDDQFATLEDPREEPLVLTVLAREPVEASVQAVRRWIGEG